MTRTHTPQGPRPKESPRSLGPTTFRTAVRIAAQVVAAADALSSPSAAASTPRSRAPPCGPGFQPGRRLSDSRSARPDSPKRPARRAPDPLWLDLFLWPTTMQRATANHPNRDPFASRAAAHCPVPGRHHRHRAFPRVPSKQIAQSAARGRIAPEAPEARDSEVRRPARDTRPRSTPSLLPMNF